MATFEFGSLPNHTDIFQQSSGVGHHWRPGYYFPDAEYHSTIRDPLPPLLDTNDKVLPAERLTTTYQTEFPTKFNPEPYKSDLVYQKAPALWKVDYVKDTIEKFDRGNSRRPLSPSHQKSETRERFATPRPLSEPNKFRTPPMQYLLNDHLNNGPTKTGSGSTENDKLKGKPFFVKDKAVLDLNDIYLTSYDKAYRAHKPDELKGYPRKDVATYWQCEEHPKAWGHGLHDNPLPKDAVPREPLPMRDPSTFKSATKVNQVPRGRPHVPHGGLRSLYQESFQQPADAKKSRDVYCPVDSPYVLPAPTPTVVYTAPGMYKTEYNNVGSGKPVTI